MTPPHEVLHALCLEAARQIAEECSSGEQEKGGEGEGAPTAAAAVSGLHGCGRPLTQLLGRQATRIVQAAHEQDDSGASRLQRRALLKRRLADLVDLAHARFYAFAPADVPACWRQLYTDACILQCAQLWLLDQSGGSSTARLTARLDELVRPLDMALILAGGAGPAHRGRTWIHAVLDVLQHGEGEDDNDWSACPTFAVPSIEDPPLRHPVPRRGPLGLQGFQAYLDAARGRGPSPSPGPGSGPGPQPLVLTGMSDHWPARRADGRPWAAPAYLRWRTLGGRRLVPVELGRSYVDAGWTQAVVPFQKVLEGLTGDGPRMYLAQHDLFAQMPRLRDDICVPDACYTVTGEAEDEDDEDDEPLTNAWLGPPGTITPLHTDPHHNLLAQVVGRKYVRLYSPEQTAALRPRGREGGVDMGNTSSIDVGAVEGWDTPGSDDEDEDDDDNLKAFLEAPYVDCILQAGDTLYIPRGWWHYVRGLSVSFSVSFWWD